MRIRVLFVSSVAAILVVGVANAAFGQEAELAREGIGLLPEPTELPSALAGDTPSRPFVVDASGGVSRIIFETGENPDFKIVIRDYSIPPDRQTHTVALPTGALLHVLSGQGEIRVGENRLALTTAARFAAPPGTPLSVANNGEHPVVVRALILEAK